MMREERIRLPSNIFFLDTLIDLFAMDWHIFRGIDPQANVTLIVSHHGYSDVHHRC